MAKSQDGKKIVPAKPYKSKPPEGEHKTIPLRRHRRCTPE